MGFPICPYYTVRAYVLHENGMCRDEPESIAVYHGAQQHQYDSELLCTRYLYFRPRGNGTADGLIYGRIYYCFYYFGEQKDVMKSDET